MTFSNTCSGCNKNKHDMLKEMSRDKQGIGRSLAQDNPAANQGVEGKEQVACSCCNLDDLER